MPRSGRRRWITGLSAALLTLAQLAVPAAARADDSDVETPRDQRAAVVWEMRNGGPATSRAAIAALLGSDADLQHYLATDEPVVTSQDTRVQVLRLLESGGPAVRAAASTALDGTDDDRERFLSVGFDDAWKLDERARALQVKTTGGIAVQQAASAALDSGDDAVEQFLLTGQFTAQHTDERVRAIQIMGTGGAATKEMAKAALDGGSDAIHEFITTSAEIAYARDQTLDSVTELAAQAQASEQKAAAETNAAKEASAQALAEADQARVAAERAKAETAAAKADATKAAAAAGRAADAAAAAASAAQTAIRAANQAHIAAQAAADAASKAAGLAVMAGNAATEANNQAAAAALDKGKADAARTAAANAKKLVLQAQNAADAATKVANMSREIAKAALDAADASSHSDAAGAAADEAGGYSQAAGAQADRARRNAAKARAAAQRATRAANQAVALANRAADAADEAAVMARSAASHAQAAADAANDAAENAGQAADKAAESKKHADNAITSAADAKAAADEAARIAQLDKDGETERLQMQTDAGILAAGKALAEDKSLTALVPWDAQEHDRWSADTKALLTQASDPAAPVIDMLAKGRQAAMHLMTSGGPFVQTAAEDALTGGEVEMRQFLAVGLEAAAEQDDRSRVGDVAENGDVPALKASAETALKGSIADVRAFMSTRAYTGKANDDRAKILATMELGPASHDAGATALDGTEADRNAYLTRGQYVAAEHDERAKILGILSGASATALEVQSSAKIALAGPESYMHGFLAVGMLQAQQRDYFRVTHEARVDATVAQAQQSALNALNHAYEAAKAAALAAGATDRANGYAAKAKASADAAAVAATKALISAAAAKQSANQAAASAATAKGAEAAAKADAAAATQSAADARYSAYLAKQHADEARASANAARASAEAAHKDATAAQQDYQEAYNVAIALIKQEDEDRRNNPDPQGSKHCDRPPGYGADPSCFPSLPGMPRDANDGDIICYSWREGQQQCTYEQIGSANKNIYVQQANAMKELSACALTIPGCWATLQFLFSIFGGQDTNDPEAMADQAEQYAMQGKLSTMMRYLKQLQKLKCAPGKNSFRGDTRVVLAGGKTRPIDRVAVGDRVIATDPVTGRTGARLVLAVYRNDDTQFTDVQVHDSSGREATVHTTPEHPFWDAARSAWTNAGKLSAGDALRPAGRSTASVIGARSFTGHRPMFNLTIADLHTFYVQAGTTPILVHNYTCDITVNDAQFPGQAHTVDDHIDVSLQRARNKAVEGEADNGIWASRDIAQKAIGAKINKSQEEIERWMRTAPPGAQKTLEGYFYASKDAQGNPVPLGTYVEYVPNTSAANLRIKPSGNRYRIVIKKDKKARPNGWYVYTSYPVRP